MPGRSADAGLTSTKGGAQNALILGGSLMVITTIINMLRVKLMARINNIGVACDLVGSNVLIVLLLFHLYYSPSAVVHSYGLGAGHPLRLLRRPARWQHREHVCDVRVRHRRDAGREDEQPMKHAPRPSSGRSR